MVAKALTGENMIVIMGPLIFSGHLQAAAQSPWILCHFGKPARADLGLNVLKPNFRGESTVLSS